MEDGPHLTTALADRVLTVTLDRPDRLNAFTGQMADELIAAFDRADADDEVRAVLAFLEKRTADFPDRVSADLPAFFPWWPDRPFTPLP